MCIVDYVMIRISKRLSDNIRKTERVVSVQISSNNLSFTSSHFQFHFLWKTYSLVTNDLQQEYLKGQVVNAKKNIKTADSMIDHVHC